MKRTTKKSAIILALLVLCFTLGFCILACDGVNNGPPDTHDPVPPVKVSDGIDLEVATGKSKNLTVADYITVNDYAPSATSDSQNATASVAQGLLTVTGVSEGNATVSLSCGEITVTFGVTVFTEYTVTVDGVAHEVKKGGTFTLPEAPTIEDSDFEFDYWLVDEEEHKDPGEEITVNGNVTVTTVPKRKAAVKEKDGDPVTVSVGKNKSLNVADYITTHGANVSAESDDTDKITVAITDGKIVFTAVAEGTATVTLTCGDITITFAVTVSGAPAASWTVKVDGTVVDTVDDGDTFTLPVAVVSSDPDFEFTGWKINGGAIKQPGEVITVEEDLVITSEITRKAAEKVKDGITVNLSTDGVTYSEITVADYITSYGRDVSAQSNDVEVATAALGEGKLTITAVAVGNTTVTLACAEVTVSFNVYVRSADDNAPVFQNGAISFDLFEKTSDSYTFEITAPEGTNYTYSYTVTPDTGVAVSGNTLTYTATAATDLVLNVAVTATDPVLGETTTAFSVTVNVTDTTPKAKQSEITVAETKDVVDGAITVDLAENITNAANVASYKVNGTAVDGTTYNVTGTYTDIATEVTLTVEAVIDATRSVTYTYKVNVIDSTAYRLINGGFENGLDGWTKVGEIGNVSSATAYWTNDNDGKGYPFNADKKFFSAYEPSDMFEKNMGTLTSSTFKVATNRTITFKLGGARHDVFVDVVDAENGAIIARYGNSAWAENNGEGLATGCTLIAYKATLPESAVGKTVYIRIIDAASSNYGVLFCDSFETFYEVVPASGFIDAVDITVRPATIYEMYNGGFESDMAGWATSGGEIGVVTSDKSCFNGGDPNAVNDAAYGAEGKLFSFWTWVGLPASEPEETRGHELNRELNMGTLTSAPVVLQNGKYVSFMLGGGSNRNVFVELVNAEDGTIIAVFHNDNVVANKEAHLNKYHYQVSLSKDTYCYFRVVDNATSGWGCFTADSFVANLDEAPADSTPAVNRKGEYKSMINGGFEDGSLNGWTAPGDDLGAVLHKNNEVSTKDWYQINGDTTEGDYLFTFLLPADNEDGCVNKESGKGVIRSSAFILEKNGIISFRFGAANNSEVYINVYTTGGQLIAQFRNNAYTAATVMVQYYYQFDNAEEISCYFEIVDNATNTYGCIVMDDFRVNLETAPENAVLGSGLTKEQRDAQ